MYRSSEVIMHSVKTNCPTCGDLELHACALTLSLYTNDKPRNFYQFICPRCQQIVARSADRILVKLLLTTKDAGLQVIETTLPLEYLEQQLFNEDNPRPTITYNDVLDLVLQLDEPVLT